MTEMAARFLPVQLDFDVPSATEAVAHAARSYIAGLQPGQGLLKLDVSNPFNKVRRDNMFQAVHDELPELYPFVHMCYARASLLNFGDHLLLSDEGAQRCVVAKVARSMSSEFNLCRVFRRRFSWWQRRQPTSQP